MSEHTKSIQNKLQGLNFVSPYKLSKIESELRNTSIPPQKLYGYVSKGYIKSNLNSTGKIQISQKSASEYLEKTMKRNS
jgi:predicted site-specific integrase-resolvase